MLLGCIGNVFIKQNQGNTYSAPGDRQVMIIDQGRPSELSPLDLGKIKLFPGMCLESTAIGYWASEYNFWLLSTIEG